MSEPTIRLIAFTTALLGMLAWEFLAPKRTPLRSRLQRWPANLGIVLVDSLLLRLLFPAAAVGIALWAESSRLGLFNWIALPTWLGLLVSLLALDIAIYFQHRFLHHFRPLWPLHRMHHSDVDFDVSTGLRFHPAEILISMLWKALAITALGAPALAVLIFEIVLNATSLFNHGNVRMPQALDRALRAVLVTPDMHRVHHSIDPREHHSNFGFCLSWWDRLFGTYTAQPLEGHLHMKIGQTVFRNPAESGLLRLLTQPFRKPDRSVV